MIKRRARSIVPEIGEDHVGEPSEQLLAEHLRPSFRRECFAVKGIAGQKMGYGGGEFADRLVRPEDAALPPCRDLLFEQQDRCVRAARLVIGGAVHRIEGEEQEVVVDFFGEVNVPCLLIRSSVRQVPFQ